jgi:ParB family chromosome partitioning protein
MAARRSALGRGLDALIPHAPEVEVKPDSEAAGRGAIEVDRIDANPEQPRRRFPEPELAQLAASIRRHGVLQPVVVRRAGERFELVVGERRWRAARLAGCTTIPAVVADVAARDRLNLALVENVQRNDLNPIELALAFRTLSANGATQEEIGDRVGLDRSSVANHLRLLELSSELQADVEDGRLSAGHAKALLQVPNPEGRRALRDRIVREQLSVRQVEEAARGLTAASSRRRRPAPVETDPDLARLVDALRDRLQTRVRLVGTPMRGRLEVEYFGGEELHRIATAILG